MRFPVAIRKGQAVKNVRHEIINIPFEWNYFKSHKLCPGEESVQQYMNCVHAFVHVQMVQEDYLFIYLFF